jgi:signal transduction histidine kinase
MPQGSGLASSTHSDIDLRDAVRRLAGDSLGEAAACVAHDLPSDLSHLPYSEIARHLLWLGRACSGRVEPTAAAESGSTTVLRRRLLDVLRARVVADWADCPPSPEVMVQTLRRLETAHGALLAGHDQSLSAELADVGGLDLVVEVAHDMRSPLTSILFLSEVLHRGQSGPLNDVQKRQIGIVYSAALGLVGMASDMIEMARGGNRLATPQPVPFSVNEMLSSVQDLVRPTAEEKSLDLRLHYLAAEKRLGYPIPLSRVLLNLTTNALKFTQSGLVELSARPAGGTRVEFSVRDTGPGIPGDAVDTLYQAFRREPGRERGYSFSGTGLGLAICRRLVTALGSELVLESRAEWGTRFSFELDLPPAEML